MLHSLGISAGTRRPRRVTRAVLQGLRTCQGRCLLPGPGASADWPNLSSVTLSSVLPFTRCYRKKKSHNFPLLNAHQPYRLFLLLNSLWRTLSSTRSCPFLLLKAPRLPNFRRKNLQCNLSSSTRAACNKLCSSQKQAL